MCACCHCLSLLIRFIAAFLLSSFSGIFLFHVHPVWSLGLFEFILGPFLQFTAFFCRFFLWLFVLSLAFCVTFLTLVIVLIAFACSFIISLLVRVFFFTFLTFGLLFFLVGSCWTFVNGLASFSIKVPFLHWQSISVLFSLVFVWLAFFHTKDWDEHWSGPAGEWSPQ